MERGGSLSGKGGVGMNIEMKERWNGGNKKRRRMSLSGAMKELLDNLDRREDKRWMRWMMRKSRMGRGEWAGLNKTITTRENELRN